MTADAAPAGPTRMFQEAAEAGRVAATLLAANAKAAERLGARLRAEPPRVVVTCGRGSSDHAGMYAKYLIETRCGVLTTSAAPSVSSVYAAAPSMQGVLFLAISQSGRSPDLLAAARAAKEGGALVVALVNDAISPLAQLAEEALPLSAGPELSVAATKSYIAALIATAQLVAAWAQDAELEQALGDLPSRLEQAWALDWTAALPTLSGARNLFVLGRGLGFGVALEAALKLKETCGLHAEAFSTAEVLHGPMALVTDGFPVLLFAQDDETREGALEIAGQLAGRGARVMSAGGPAPGGGVTLPTLAADPALQPILLVQSFYRLAEAVARARGFDPDRPPHLRKVTETV